jgi:hypothetical protein
MTHPERIDTATMVRRNGSSSLLEGALLLVVGFVFFNRPDFSDNREAVDYAIDILIWGFRLGGSLTVATALLCWTGWQPALLLDSVVSLLTGLALLVPSLMVLMTGSVIAILVAFFGVMSLRNAWSTWTEYRLLSMTASPASAGFHMETTEAPDESAPPEPDPTARESALRRLLASKEAKPVAPPTVDVRPRKDEPAPDGFLAELGRDQEPRRD